MIDFLKRAHLSYFSKPAERCAVYRAVSRQPIQSMVQLGVGDGQFARKLICLAQQNTTGRIRYTGVDLFEMRPKDNRGLALKDAHALLTATGAKVSLAPGEPLAALARVANALTDTDLLIVSPLNAESLSEAWFYVPRMLHEKSVVFHEHAKSGRRPMFCRMTLPEVDRLAVNGYQAARRAA